MVAAFLIYQLIISLIAGLVAWGVEQIAAVLQWPRRGVWAAAALASLIAPICSTRSVFIEEQSRASDIPQLVIAADAPTSDPVAVQSAPAVEQARPSRAQVAQPAERVPSPSEARWPVIRVPVLPEWDAVLSAVCITVSMLCMIALAAVSIRLSRRIQRLSLQQVDGVMVRIAPTLGPAVFGWFRPQIVLPRWVIDSAAHRAAVLAHERSHATAHDSLLFNLSLAALTLAPWNPFLWWQVLRLRFAIEVDCDRRLLRAGLDVSRYGQALLQVAQLSSHTSAGTLALIEAASQLGARVHIMTVEPSRTTRMRLLAASLGALSASVICAAQVEPPQIVLSTGAAQPQATAQQPEETLDREVRGAVSGPLLSNPISSNGAPKSLRAQADALREAVADPDRRRALLQQERMTVEQSNPDLIDVLQVDATTGNRLLELLADQGLAGRVRGLENLASQMERGPTSSLEDARVRQLGSRDRDSVLKTLREQRDAIKQLLGEVAFGRYLEYSVTSSARFAVARLTSGFGTDALTPKQREQMITLLDDENHFETAQYLLTSSAVMNDPAIVPPVRGRRMTAESTQALLKAREATARRKLQQGQRLLEASASILSPAQRAELLQNETGRIAAERSSIQELRRALDEYDNATGAARPSNIEAPLQQPLAGPLKWSLWIAVNYTDVRFLSFDGTFGQPILVNVSPGLLVEATPIAYDTQKLVSIMKIYEIDSAGKRHLIAHVNQMTKLRGPTPTTDVGEKIDLMPVASEVDTLSLSVTAELQ